MRIISFPRKRFAWNALFLVSFTSIVFTLSPQTKAQSLFQATPLIDLTSGGLYQNKFNGMLYNNSNTLAGTQDADARAAAAAVVPLDAQGNPSLSGKIGVVAIGMSNWTDEICVGADANADPSVGCATGTFMQRALAAQQLGMVNSALVFVDCAQAGQDAGDWSVADSSGWRECLNSRLPATGLTPKQIEVVLWKEGDIQPASNDLSTLAVMAGNACTKADTRVIDSCFYEQHTANAARLMRNKFQSVQLMFLHSRIYGGYANLVGSTENPEPYAYEYGFATKWLIEAQGNQLNGGGVDSIAGNLSLEKSPVLLWGPYLWASGTTPRSDGLVWLRSDFDASDGTHPTESGWTKVANMLISFYSSSPYATPWFN